MNRQTALAFEDIVQQRLLCNRLSAGQRSGFNRKRATFQTVVLDFIHEAEPKG